mmetsp:Transcript_1653/g.3942  ORF Transcript_1653/g.3942 Transcript_1653/m.3942 type:complete len:284 (+) Transcript_1653:1499-2350(+)
MASCTASLLNSCTDVMVGFLMGGGVRMVEVSRTPDKDICSVRGMGVADNVKTSTPLLITLSLSFCLTPNRCSSSMTSRDRSLNDKPFPSKACVPTIKSTFPAAMSSRMRRPALVFLPIPPRSIPTLTLNLVSSPILFTIFLKCWAARTPVGARRAACLPFATALNSARRATSVFPNPTSPHINLSMGRDRQTISFSTCSKHVTWSGVGSNGNVSSNSCTLVSRPGSHGGRVSASLVAYRASTSCAMTMVFSSTLLFAFTQAPPLTRDRRGLTTASPALYRLKR